MAPTNLMRMVLVLVGAASLGACATTSPAGPTYPEPRPAPTPAPAPPPLVLPPAPRGFPPPPPVPDGLLSALPRDARAGECFAKVSVRGAMLAPPPVPPHAVWVMTPPRPGDIGPTFCLYFEPGAPPPPAFAPDRIGWIRVVCDGDLTPGRVRGLQRRLGALGLYQGAVHGRYDAPTARAVARFQQRSAIPHGGFLSLETMNALEGPQPLGRPDDRFSPPPPQTAPLPPGLSAQALTPPGLPPGAVVLPAPCAAALCAGAGPVRSAGTPPDRGYLSWPGKSLY